MSDAVAHTLDGCEVQPLGEELNPEREELLVDMDVVRERGLEIINTTAYIAITGTVYICIYSADTINNVLEMKKKTWHKYYKICSFLPLIVTPTLYLCTPEMIY